MWKPYDFVNKKGEVMKKIHLGIIGFVAAVAISVVAVFLCVGCNDSGIASGGGEAMEFLNRFSGGAEGTYESVVIGGKRWMKKNLDIKMDSSWCYGEGGKVRIGTTYVEIEQEEIDQNCQTYGRLYTWSAAKLACQSVGWRMATGAEWENMVAEAGGYGVAGKKLKAGSGWYDNGNGTDDFGFGALPGGSRNSEAGGSFHNVGISGHWWRGPESGNDYAHSRVMGYNWEGVGDDSDEKSIGYSVRCVKDK